MAKTAKVYLVGAGPGDPDLLTRKAARILEKAEVLIYDRLVSPETLALANPDATFIYAGKQRGQQEDVQAEIYAWFLRLAHCDGPIVRLKCGDPMIFSRGGEELEFLVRHGFDVEVVPGVSAVTAAPALAGIPLTHRGLAASFAVVAGHGESLREHDWSVYRGIDTLVVLMGVENRRTIAARLMELGRPASQPVAFLERVSTDAERVVESTLGEVASGAAQVEAPAVLVIGEVVRLRASAKSLQAPDAVSGDQSLQWSPP